ncbi:DUF1499 domain-containing protein [Roseicyclus sp.]|uniref:DUF1499 domain-containing protein n=1 Tax=Roseicyclus sp. TaxID=1914329 RepID=UPI003F6B00EF
MMRMLLILSIILVLAVLAGAVWFRVVPMPAAQWHVEPARVIPPSSPNFALRVGADAPVFTQSPAVIAEILSRIADDAGAKPIAGSPAEGHVSYVLRSALMGFPDVVSIRIIPEGAGTRVEIFSRSRYGYSDLGVNAARVAAWVGALGAQTGP